MRRVCRLLWRCWAAHVRYLLSSGIFVLVSCVQPVVFATIACYLFRAGGRPGSLLYAAIGAGMLQLWATTLIGSGQALSRLRIDGVLELLVAAPAPFGLVLAPITLATATVGLFSMLATVTWGRLLFGVPLHAAHPWLLLAAVPAMVFGLGMLGMVLASVFVRFRNANALTALGDYPVWLASGLLVPASLLPSWVGPVSWLLPTTWGVRAVRDSVLGGHPVAAIGGCLALGAGYLAVGLVTVGAFERAARRHASLALA